MAMNRVQQEYAAASRIFNILEKQSPTARQRILGTVTELLQAAPETPAVDPRQDSLFPEAAPAASAE